VLDSKGGRTKGGAGNNEMVIFSIRKWKEGIRMGLYWEPRFVQLPTLEVAELMYHGIVFTCMGDKSL